MGPSGCGKSVLACHVAKTLKQRYNLQENSSNETPSNLGGPRPNPHSVDDLSTKATVLRFFCKDPRNNAVEADYKASSDEGGAARASTPLIEAFLYQMLEQNRQLFSAIPTSLSHSETPVDLKDVQEMFRQILDNHRDGHVLLIIDGLDECDEEYIKESVGLSGCSRPRFVCPESAEDLVFVESTDYMPAHRAYPILVMSLY